MRAIVLGLALVVAASCGGRRDTAELALDQPPFDELRGLSFSKMRSGGARAFRRGVFPVPDSGLRELIGPYTVTYVVPVFDTLGGKWPVEDALVLEIVAERAWESDSAAFAAWKGSLRAVREASGSEPRCNVTKAGSMDTAVEFDRGDSTFLGIEYVTGDTLDYPARTRTRLYRSSHCPPS